MTTRLQRLTGSLFLVLLVLLGWLILAAPTRAADTTVGYQLPSGDTTGISATTPPGLSGCLSGCAWLRIPAGANVAARRQGQLAFAAPSGTTIVGATLRIRYRTKQNGVAAVLQSRLGGRWIAGQRLRSVGGTSATLSTGRGATAVAVALTADTAIAGRTVRNATDNSVSVESVQLTVRDAHLPSVAWGGADPVLGGWQRGQLCGAFTAADRGLGVDRVEYAIGSVVAAASAGPGTRLQPRPLQFAGSVCVDTAQLPDGTYGTALTAVDTGADGNRSAPLANVVRVDNAPPSVTYKAPADPEARLPEIQLAVTDAASGLDSLSATIDGLAAEVRLAAGVAVVVPPQPLADGLHRLAWTAADVAGNATSGSETFGVADRTPPVIDDVQPQGVVGPFAPVSAHATDSGAGLAADAWRLAIDGVDVTGAAELGSAGTIVFTPTRAWGEGEHVVRATVIDRSGNRTVRTWTFSLPVSPPPAPAPLPPVAPAAPEVASAATEPLVEPETAAVTAPRPRLTLLAERQRVRAGGQTRLRGVVAGTGIARVRIEARVGRRWRLVVVVPVAADGRFATPVRLPERGAYDVRARAQSLRSAVLRLTAR